MDFLTGFSLVVAGLMVGYFLRYRVQSESDQRIHSLNLKNEELGTALHQTRDRYNQLDEKYHRQKGQLAVLQQLCDDWSDSRERLKEERSRLEQELIEKSRLNETLAAESQSEKQKRISLEDINHQLTQQQIQKLKTLENEWLGKHTQIEKSLLKQIGELEQANRTNADLAEKLADAENQVAILTQELSENQNTETSAEVLSELSRLESVDEKLAAKQQELSDALNKMDQLQQEVLLIEPLRTQLESTQNQLKANESQLSSLTCQRDEAIKAEKSSLIKARGFQHRIENQETTIHILRHKHESSLESLKKELSKRDQLEMDFENAERQYQEQVSRLAAELESKAASLARAESSNSELVASHSQSRSEYEAEFAKKETLIANLRSDIETRDDVILRARNTCESA
ncbi:MAG: hypothetical protein AAF939_15385, partial [Planctomycetota bacterium]